MIPLRRHTDPPLLQAVLINNAFTLFPDGPTSAPAMNRATVPTPSHSPAPDSGTISTPDPCVTETIDKLASISLMPLPIPIRTSTPVPSIRTISTEDINADVAEADRQLASILLTPLRSANPSRTHTPIPFRPSTPVRTHKIITTVDPFDRLRIDELKRAEPARQKNITITKSNCLFFLEEAIEHKLGILKTRCIDFALKQMLDYTGTCVRISITDIADQSDTDFTGLLQAISRVPAHEELGDCQMAELFEALSPLCPAIVSFCLINTDKTLRPLNNSLLPYLQRCAALTALGIKQFELALSDIPQCCPGLQKLILRSCSGFSSEDIASLKSQMPELVLSIDV